MENPKIKTWNLLGTATNKMASLEEGSPILDKKTEEFRLDQPTIDAALKSLLSILIANEFTRLPSIVHMRDGEPPIAFATSLGPVYQ